MENNEQWPDNPLDELHKEYAHRLHLVGKVIKRDGKFYEQFIDGEREITLEYANKMIEASNYMLRFSAHQRKKYAKMNWTLATMPNDIDSFTKADLFIEDLDKCYWHLSNKNGGIIVLWPRLRFMLGILINQANEMLYDYSGSSKQFREYYKNKLECLRSQWEDLYQLNLHEKNSKKSTDKLTQRERILIHCYEKKEVIKRGEPDYNDYITFATPRKRTAYPNGSPIKAKRLVCSINKILPYLSENAKQQAINEVNTIESNI